MFLTRLAEKKLNKNQTEKDRKDEISGLIKGMSSLVLGQENENLQELTRARLMHACLAEIPHTIIQFYTDGKSAEDRPLSIFFFFHKQTHQQYLICSIIRYTGFYDELRFQLNILSERFHAAQNEAYSSRIKPVVSLL